jgi:hypothetical protein
VPNFKPDLGNKYCLAPGKCGKMATFGWNLELFYSKTFNAYATA